MAQVVVGGLVLIVSFAWPPLLIIFCLIFVGRIVGRAGRGDKLSAFAAGGVILALTITLMYVFSEFAFIVMVMGVVAAVWLVAGRLRAARLTV